MSADRGMGSCLIAGANGIPCGLQIEEGAPIGTVMSPGGPLVGHKDCAAAYEQRKREQMVKIGRQQGPGGAIPGPEQYKEGIQGSIPLEKPEEPPHLSPVPPGAESLEQPPMAGDPKQTGTPLPSYSAGAIAPGVKEARAAVTAGTVEFASHNEFNSAAPIVTPGLAGAKALVQQGMNAQHPVDLRVAMLGAALVELITQLEAR
jgi:hypothetical protein